MTQNRDGFFANALQKLRRLILNKSGQKYLAELTGGDAYWDRIIAAQRRINQQGAGSEAEKPKG